MNTYNKNHPVYKYILDCVNENARAEYNLKKDPETDAEKLQFVIDTFKKEFSHEIKRQGIYRAFSEWLQGLPTAFNVDFRNYDILQLAKKWNSIPENATEKQEDKILSNWWNFITVKFFQLCKRNNVNK